MADLTILQQDQEQLAEVGRYKWQDELPRLAVSVLEEIFGAHHDQRTSRRHTIKAIDRDVHIAYDFLNFTKKAFWDCAEHDFEKWSTHLGVDRNLATSSQRHYQGVIRSLFQYIVSNSRFPNLIRHHYNISFRQICTDDNCVPHILNREIKGKREALSHKQIGVIFDSLDQAAREAKRFRTKDLYPLLRDKVMFFLTYATGGRISEIIGLDIDSFCPNPMIPAMGDYGFVYFQRKGSNGSGKKPQHVPISHLEIPALMEWYLTHVRPHFAQNADPNEKALFMSERNKRIGVSTLEARFQKTLELAGLDGLGFTPHCLRHSSITHDSLNVSLNTVRDKHGHVHASTTQGYTHIPDEYTARDIAKSVAANIQAVHAQKANNKENT